jgi:hypothetical protein
VQALIHLVRQDHDDNGTHRNQIRNPHRYHVPEVVSEVHEPHADSGDCQEYEEPNTHIPGGVSYSPVPVSPFSHNLTFIHMTWDRCFITFAV